MKKSLITFAILVISVISVQTANASGSNRFFGFGYGESNRDLSNFLTVYTDPLSLRITAASAGTPTGRVNGKTSFSDNVSANSTKTYYTSFWGGEIAIVAVVGDGDTDLDLYVYDSYGNLVAYDDGRTDVCRVSWYPDRMATYTIKVKNRGTVYNTFGFATN
jgi:hypothetical protein